MSDWFIDRKPIDVKIGRRKEQLTVDEVAALLNALDKPVLLDKEPGSPLASAYIKLRGREPRFLV